MLDLTFYDSQIIMMTNIKNAFTSVLSFSASYYNVYLSRWEPILEKIGIEIDYADGEACNPKMYLNVQMNNNYDTLNFNISNHMVRRLK